VPYLCPHPWVYRSFLFLMGPELRRLDRSVCSEICFVVARDNTCRFCYGSFRASLRVAGYSESELDRIERALHEEHARRSADEVLQFAVQVSQGRLDETALGGLSAAGHGPTAIREAAGISVLAGLVNRVGTMLAVPLNTDLERMTTQWYFDLVQPVVQRLLSGWQRLRAPSEPPLRAEAVDGPLAPWLSHLRGTCVGHVLHEMTVRWLTQDSALPLRTKLLVLAVVARGLGDERLEERAEMLLAERCAVSTEAFEAAVSHRRGDAVRSLDEALLPLARASIRYEAGQVQRTVRDCAADLSRAETIDAVATFGLTNALARLHVLAPLDD
jgi:AhpD family alkylhydroperoxidase